MRKISILILYLIVISGCAGLRTQQEPEGNYVEVAKLGVNFEDNNNELVVNALQKNFPAEFAGVKRGDVLVSIDSGAVLPASVTMPNRIYFSGTANNDVGLQTLSMTVSGPRGVDIPAFVDASVSGLTSKDLSGYCFDSNNSNYAGVAGSYTVTLSITDTSDQTTSQAFNVTVSANPLSSGPILYWSFDNCDARDDSGNAHDGTMVANPLCVSGVKSSGLQLNADYLIIPPLNLGNIYTHNLWFKFICAYDMETIFSYGSYWNHDIFYGVWISPQGDVCVHYQTADNEEYWNLAGNINDNRFHMLTSVMTLNLVDFYIDGVLSKTINIFPIVDINGRSGYINHHDWAGGQSLSRMIGVFDEFSIYGRGLSAEEIRQLYTGN